MILAVGVVEDIMGTIPASMISEVVLGLQGDIESVPRSRGSNVTDKGASCLAPHLKNMGQIPIRQ